MILGHGLTQRWLMVDPRLQHRYSPRRFLTIDFERQNGVNQPEQCWKRLVIDKGGNPDDLRQSLGIDHCDSPQPARCAAKALLNNGQRRRVQFALTGALSAFSAASGSSAFAAVSRASCTLSGSRALITPIQKFRLVRLLVSRSSVAYPDAPVV
jgi:hypothetical protein